MLPPKFQLRLLHEHWSYQIFLSPKFWYNFEKMTRTKILKFSFFALHMTDIFTLLRLGSEFSGGLLPMVL